jgi:hypothetical protein
MLAHEIIGFPVPGKVDFVAVLLQVMPEVEGPRSVPESFPADNKKEFHGDPAGMVCSLSSYPGAGLPSGCRQSLLRGFFRECRDYPGSEINDDTDARGEEGNDHPDQADDGRIDIDVFRESPADSARHLHCSGAVQPFHVHKMVV